MGRPTVVGGWRTVTVLVVGVLASLGLAVVAASAQRANARQALDRRATDAAHALQSVLPILQVPLASSVAIAEHTGRADEGFEQVVSGLVGPGSLLGSASLWTVEGETVSPVSTLGGRDSFAALPADEQVEILLDAPAGGIGIVDLTAEEQRALGFTWAGSQGRHVAYFEVPLPDDPTGIDLTGDAYDDLEISVHLGDTASPERLLFATTTDLPLADDAMHRTISWGDGSLTLAVVPVGPMGDPVLAWLPWAIGGTGVALSAATALLVRKLERARQASAQLAEVNASLFVQQRTVAQQLQRSLLPDPLPIHPAVQLASRYQAGADGVEIGGDWYDAIAVDHEHLVVAVGDVSGQGLPAAATMVRLQMAMRAYAAEGHGPAEILSRLSALLDVRTDGHLATVACICLHLHEDRAVIATAGHPAPAIVRGDGRVEVPPVEPGLPIGVADHPVYRELSVPFRPGDTVVGFTDGLYERRGEVVDVGLERVRSKLAELGRDPLGSLVDRLADDLGAAEAGDDTAIIAVRALAVGPPCEPGDDVAATLGESAPVVR